MRHVSIRHILRRALPPFQGFAPPGAMVKADRKELWRYDANQEPTFVGPQETKRYQYLVLVL
jgi:hypothetical protein